MPLHDWRLVHPQIFHAFHIAWLTHLSEFLNCGGLPDGYYTLVEHNPPQKTRSRAHRRTLNIRHVIGHRVVALVEIVSPADKSRPNRVKSFVSGVTGVISEQIHLTLIDIFPPGPHDPLGMEAAIGQSWGEGVDQYKPPPDAELFFAAYLATPPRPETFVQHANLGRALPDMPVFLEPETLVNLPLEPTYNMAFRGMAEYWRAVLEAAAG